jgi:hypothetical protein
MLNCYPLLRIPRRLPRPSALLLYVAVPEGMRETSSLKKQISIWRRSLFLPAARLQVYFFIFCLISDCLIVFLLSPVPQTLNFLRRSTLETLLLTNKFIYYRQAHFILAYREANS